MTGLDVIIILIIVALAAAGGALVNFYDRLPELPPTKPSDAVTKADVDAKVKVEEVPVEKVVVAVKPRPKAKKTETVVAPPVKKTPKKPKKVV